LRKDNSDVGPLTETEQAVAELIVNGRTSNEAAAELFMGVRTLETHLSRIYNKLGVRSRTELAQVMRTARL
jgi:DNA-binding NarL/FixJ family response regulator